MKKGNKIILLLIVVVLSLGFSATAEAKKSDVTKKHKKSVTKMLKRLDLYLCYEIAYGKPQNKFVFNNYAKTSMMLMGKVKYRASVSRTKAKFQKQMNLYFGSSAKFKLKKSNSEYSQDKIQHLFKNYKGIVTYNGGDWGGSYPKGFISKIYKTGKRSYYATYKQYIMDDYMNYKEYRGTYKIYLKKSSNKYGFIITNIKRTHVAN